MNYSKAASLLIAGFIFGNVVALINASESSFTDDNSTNSNTYATQTRVSQSLPAKALFGAENTISSDVVNAFTSQLNIMDIIERISRSDPQFALQLMRTELSNEQFHDLFGTVFERLVEADPAAAAEALSSIDDIGMKHYGAEQLALKWAYTDLDSAFEWLETLDNSYPISNIYTTLMHSYGQQDPRGAAQIMLSLESGALQEQMLSSVLHNIGNEDIDYAFTWLSSLRSVNDNISSGAETALLGIWAKQAPLNALNFALNDEKLSQDYFSIHEVVENYAETNPHELAQQISKLPKQNKESAIYELAKEWVQSDQLAMQSWIERLPQSEQDIALLASADNIAQTDALVAMQLANNINDDVTRTDAIAGIYSTWLIKNPEQAELALSQVSLNEQQLEVLSRLQAQLTTSDQSNLINIE